MMNPDDYCREKAARSGSSAHYAFLFLPPEKQRAITALQAFCREVEDIVDKTSEASVARMKLAWWRSQVELIFGGKPDHPVAVALSAHVESCHLRADPLYAVIEASEKNLDQFRYADWTELQQYCWLAGGEVGELWAGILGQTEPGTRDYAQKLGVALQLTSILCDVGEDARRGRIYLPGDEMDAHGVTVDDILDAHHSSAFEALMQQQAQRTRALYREAVQALPAADQRAQRPGLMMAAIYSTLLDEVERDGWHVLDQHNDLTPVRKFWLAWKTWVTGGSNTVRRLSAR